MNSAKSKPESLESMIDPLSFLKCPETRSKLSHADAELLAQLNEGISRGAITNRLGQTISLPIDKGLVNETKTLFFLVIDDIPQMVLDEAISLEPFIVEPKREKK